MEEGRRKEEFKLEDLRSDMASKTTSCNIRPPARLYVLNQLNRMNKKTPNLQMCEFMIAVSHCKHHTFAFLSTTVSPKCWHLLLHGILKTLNKSYFICFFLFALLISKNLPSSHISF